MADIVEMFTVWARSPPVPQVSTAGPGTVTAARARASRDQPAISAGDSPFARSASGYFLLLFRHGFLPLSRRVLIGIGGLVVATSIFAVFAELPSGEAPPEYTTLQTVAITLLIGLSAIA